MANKFLIAEFDGTPPSITLRNSGDFSPTPANDLRHASAVDVEYQLNLTSVANGAYRQSAKVDFTATRGIEYVVRAALEFAVAPTDGTTVSLFPAPSQHATAGTGNAGNVSGSDAAYTGYSSNAASAVKQLESPLIGVLTVQATTTVQVINMGRFSPSERYYSFVFLNSSGQAMMTDAVEMHIVFDPIVVKDSQ